MATQRSQMTFEHDDEELVSTMDNTLDLNSMRAMHNLQSAFTIAKKFPRDEAQCVQRILNSCKRISLAAKGLYQYPKGGTSVKGASIRLAEEIARQWGNFDCGVREISRKDNESVVESYAIDLETNVRKSLEFTVKHEIETKSGAKPLTDPRAIYEHIANQGARRLRACILASIPMDVVEDAEAACERTLNDENRTKPKAERVRAMVDAFDKLGVTVTHLEARLGHKIDLCIDAEIAEFGAIHNSIRDNMSKREDWFSIHEQPVASHGKGMSGFKSLIGVAEPMIESVEIDGKKLEQE